MDRVRRQMTPRERQEQWERDFLAPWASRAADSLGRAMPEEPDPVRTVFQRDRDRIVHSKAFRRLKHKTQVFIDPASDHIRTRLTHTLEVAQIARTIARALHLNEDLTEAIALAHDLGHPPFGHAGEEALDGVYREYVPTAGFRHYEQSLRVVDLLEQHGEHRGLNLTWEVRDGIAHHSKGRADLTDQSAQRATTLEGKVVRIADRVAYINHDIDDAVRFGLLTLEDLPENAAERLGRTHSQRIASMVIDIVEFSDGRDDVDMSPETARITDQLKEFLFTNVYWNPQTGSDELGKAQRVVRDLFQEYMTHPEKVRPELVQLGPEECAQEVCDYVAGMTDRYAVTKYAELFLPRGARLPEIEPG